jgi:hypothetical protein
LRAKLIWQETGVTNTVIYHADGERKEGKRGREWKGTGNELKIYKKKNIHNLRWKSGRAQN